MVRADFGSGRSGVPKPLRKSLAAFLVANPTCALAEFNPDGSRLRETPNAEVRFVVLQQRARASGPSLSKKLVCPI